MAREDQTHVKVTVAGKDLGTWDARVGGNADSEESKYRPGGGLGQVSLGGAKVVENVTVRRMLKPDRDRQLLDFLLSQRGLGASMEVIDQGLDADNVAFGNPIVFIGTLKAVNFPDSDSQSNDAALYELEQSTVDVVAV